MKKCLHWLLVQLALDILIIVTFYKEYLRPMLKYLGLPSIKSNCANQFYDHQFRRAYSYVRTYT